MHGEASLFTRLGTVLLVMAGIAAAVGAALSTGAIRLPSLFHSQRSVSTSLAAERTAANRQWASALCTNLLGWKNQIERDGTSLDLGFGPMARIKDATTATTRMLSNLEKLGLPPAGQTAQVRAETNQLRSAVASRALKLETDAASVASGNLGAIGTLVTDLEQDRSMGTAINNQLRRVVSVDLGLSLAETRTCRQLVGIPV
jgi:hypothetical protein